MLRQFLESSGGLVRQSFQDVFEVAVGVVAVELDGLDQTHDAGGAFTCAITHPSGRRTSGMRAVGCTWAGDLVHHQVLGSRTRPHQLSANRIEAQTNKKAGF
jgi:hypothetical protein